MASFSIGLDKVIFFIYTPIMKINLRSHSAGSSKKTMRKDFIEFVADQFKQLSKKNIRIPIKLYQL